MWAREKEEKYEENMPWFEGPGLVVAYVTSHSTGKTRLFALPNCSNGQGEGEHMEE